MLSNCELQRPSFQLLESELRCKSYQRSKERCSQFFRMTNTSTLPVVLIIELRMVSIYGLAFKNNNNNISVGLVHQREREPILPNRDHILPSFKVRLLPSDSECKTWEGVITTRASLRGLVCFLVLYCLV